MLELLSETGLGKEMHSVVSQGRVEAIVTSKPRDRRLLILGIVAAQGNETILKLQFRHRLDKGDLTRADLTEILIFLNQYAGFPLSVVANNVARRVLKEMEG